MNKYLEAAKAELAEYHAQLVKGGEPHYPHDAQAVIAAMEAPGVAREPIIPQPAGRAMG